MLDALTMISNMGDVIMQTGKFHLGNQISDKLDVGWKVKTNSDKVTIARKLQLILTTSCILSMSSCEQAILIPELLLRNLLKPHFHTI